MAVPAIGLDIVAVVTSVAEFSLVHMAAVAGFLQADFPVSAICRFVYAFAVADGFVAPDIQQLHMIGAHPLRRFDTCVPLAACGQSHLWVFVFFSADIDPEWCGEKHDSDHKTGDYVFFVIHRLVLLRIWIGIGVGQVFLTKIELAWLFTFHD